MRGVRGTMAVVTVLAGTLATTVASAGEPQFSPTLDKCLETAKGVTADMINCIGAETKVQDKRLNDAYKAAVAKLTPARQKELQGVQRLWIQFRDANCKFAYDPDGGTMASVESTGCVMSMTAERAQELEAIADR